MRKYFLGVARRFGNTTLGVIGTGLLLAISLKFWHECGRLEALGAPLGAVLVGFCALAISLITAGCTVAVISYFFGWMDD